MTVQTLSQLELFVTHLKVVNRTEDTINRYKATVKEFIEAVGEKKTYAKQDVEAYQMRLIGRGAKGAYLRYCYYCLKTFFDFLEIKWPFKKSEVPKLDAPVRRWYTYEEMETIMKAAKPHLRDWLAFRFIVISMGRRKTISVLRRTDYDPEKGTILQPSIKKGRTPLIQLDPETNEAMIKYLYDRRDPYPALFPSKRSRNRTGHLTLPALNMMLAKYCKVAGVENKGLHAFRRGMVTFYHRHGQDVKQIWGLGDWKSEQQVNAYIQLDPQFATVTRENLHPFWSRERNVERKPTEEEKKALKAKLPSKAS